MSALVTLARSASVGLALLLGFTLTVGVLYPLAVTTTAQLVLPWQSQGSLVTLEGERTTEIDQAVGSVLLGQNAEPQWFQPRPSAAGDGYDPRASGGSNLGPNNRELLATVQQRRALVAEREGVEPRQVPADAVTASGSGLDPHISPEYALLQVPRVARAHGLDEAEVRALVAEETDGRGLGVLGEPRVTVLSLNLAVRGLAGS